MATARLRSPYSSFTHACPRTAQVGRLALLPARSRCVRSLRTANSLKSFGATCRHARLLRYGAKPAVRLTVTAQQNSNAKLASEVGNYPNQLSEHVCHHRHMHTILDITGSIDRYLVPPSVWAIFS
eukprot:651822-Prorocentrum_minimum.AAC.5